MADYGFYKNSEGYADPTAAEAIKGRAKPGEIWTYNGKEVLIVKNQGTYCNILTLGVMNKPNYIEIAGYYSQPGMLSYAFSDYLGECVCKLTDIEYNDVLEEIAEALQMPLVQQKTQREESGGSCCVTGWINELVEKQKIIIREKEDEAQRLRGQVELMKNMYNDLLSKALDKVGA